MNVNRERIRKQSKGVAAYMAKPRKYNVTWTCPHCGNGHNWWWEEEFEAHDDGKILMSCDRCEAQTWCKGDGNGFYEPIEPGIDEPPGIERRVSDLESLEKVLHNYVRGLEDRVNTTNKLAFDAINTVTIRLIELENAVAQRDSGFKDEEEEEKEEDTPSFLDLINGLKQPFHYRLRQGCQFTKEELPPDKLASVLRFIAVEVERMTERDMGGSFTISNVKAAAKLRELAEEAELADYTDYDEDEDDAYCAPEEGDMRVSDDDPTAMKVFTGTAWLPIQQTLKEADDAQTNDR